MKKSLVLAMAMALGVTASAYAANPFSDVPAGHWAYDSIAKLADAGVIEGYGDTTFGGDKLMTRYEMAQIVARAMANGANVDKLAAEFADELDNLGVRVAKLEKKADNVKITGQIRYEYAARDGSVSGSAVAKHRLRTRLFVNGAINDNWKYTARIQNDQDLTNAEGDETTKLNMAYVTGKLGGVDVVAGKAPMFLGNGNIYDDYAEFVRLSYGKDLKISAYVGTPTDYGFDNFYGAELSYKVGDFRASVGFDKFMDRDYDASSADDFSDTSYSKFAEVGGDNEIWNVQVGYTFGDVDLSVTYLNADYDEAKGNLGDDDDGFVVELSYLGAKASKPGSWGIWAKYYDQGVGTTIAHTMKTADWNKFVTEGFEGYGVGVTYTLAKNMVYMLDYYDLEGKESDDDARVLWSRLQITF